MHRYAANKMGTTYVYDFPEMFRKALLKCWTDYQVFSLVASISRRAVVAVICRRKGALPGAATGVAWNP